MRNVILLLILGLACINPLSSQLTLVEDQNLNVSGTTLEYALYFNVYMAVGDEDFGEFYWEIIRLEPLPEEWQFGVTDLNAGYNFGLESCQTDKPNIVSSFQDTIQFSIDLKHNDIVAEGCVLLRLWPKEDSSATLIEVPICYDVEFASSTIDTEIVTDVLVTPNPVADFLTVDLVSSELSNVQLEVINFVGQLVATQIVNVSSGSNTVTFDAADYVNGVYSIITRSDAGITTAKFIVSK